MAGNAIVSSTCWDAFKNSPMLKDPESVDGENDRDRFRVADRWVSVLLLGKLMVARFRDGSAISMPPFSMLIRAFAAKSLLTRLDLFQPSDFSWSKSIYTAFANPTLSSS